MRARTIREGSVGLLILLGIGLFGGLVLWLRGFNPTNRPYELVAEFPDATGVQVGTTVLYRGVAVGRVTAINAASNSVDVAMEISQKNLRIPSDVNVETVESGLIGEMSIDITPGRELPASAVNLSPTAKGCDNAVILCSGDRLMGTAGPSYEEFLRSASGLTDLFADPDLLEDLKTLLANASETTTEAGALAKEATELARLARLEIVPLSDAAKGATDSAAKAAQQVEVAAAQFTLTATDLNSLIGENRGTLVDTLDNVQAASSQLRDAAEVLGPTIQSGELVGNLEVLVENAAVASADLQAITSSLNTPANLVLLQQTLESARDALMSAQKVMADVDEITGDPAIRDQLRNLINGLGQLVSSTQSLEQQSEVARSLVPLSDQLSTQLSAHRSEQAPTEPAQSSPPSTRASGQAPSAAADSSLRAAQSTQQLENLLFEASLGRQPVLVFDGERYIVRPRTQLAEGRVGLSQKDRRNPELGYTKD